MDNFVPLESIEVLVYDLVLVEERLTGWVISGPTHLNVAWLTLNFLTKRQEL